MTEPNATEWRIKLYRFADDGIPDMVVPHPDEASAKAQFESLKDAVTEEGGKVELWPPNARKWKFLFSMQPPSPKEP